MRKQQKGLASSLSRGFTLIELLVVIAIIGILATIVMVSLNTARGKAADAAVKADLKTIMTQAEMVYDSGTSNSYANVCGASQDATIAKAIAAATAQVSSASVICAATTGSWAVSAATLKGAGGGWCVDSTGANKAGVLTGTTDYDCP